MSSWTRIKWRHVVRVSSTSLRVGIRAVQGEFNNFVGALHQTFARGVKQIQELCLVVALVLGEMRGICASNVVCTKVGVFLTFFLQWFYLEFANLMTKCSKLTFASQNISSKQWKARMCHNILADECSKVIMKNILKVLWPFVQSVCSRTLFRCDHALRRLKMAAFKENAAKVDYRITFKCTNSIKYLYSGMLWNCLAPLKLFHKQYSQSGWCFWAGVYINYRTFQNIITCYIFIINFLLTENSVITGKYQTEVHTSKTPVWYFTVITKQTRLIRGLWYGLF